MKREMRRQDRNITDSTEIAAVMEECHIINVGIQDGEGVYVVPLHFGYEQIDGTYFFYSHSATEGRKIDLLKDPTAVGFEMFCNVNLIVAEKACGYGSTFKSIMGEGTASLLKDRKQKEHALQQIMKHYTEKTDWEIPAVMLDKISIICIEAKEISCKIHK